MKSLRPDQLQHIVKLYKVYTRRGVDPKEACRQIGELYERSAPTIELLIRRLTADTRDLAQAYFQSNALKMAMGVVREASVTQKIDILSRPNMAVLAPVRAGAEGQRGFILTVSADSCGAVKATAAMIEGGPTNAITGGEVSSEDDTLWQESQARLRGESGGGGEESQDGGDAHPRGISAGPDPQEQGLQVIDVHPEEEVGRDSLGRRSFAKTPEGLAHMRQISVLGGKANTGWAKSKGYQEALERARKRIEDAKLV